MIPRRVRATPGTPGTPGTPECCLACGYGTIVSADDQRRCAECGESWPVGTLLVRVRRATGPTDRGRRGRRLTQAAIVASFIAVAVHDRAVALTLFVPTVVLLAVVPLVRRRHTLGGYAITPAAVEAWWNGRRHRTIPYGELTSDRLSPRLGRRPLLLLGHPRGRGFDRAELLTDDATIERLRAVLDRRLPERLPWSPQ